MANFVPKEETFTVIPGFSNYAVSDHGRVINMKFDRFLTPSASVRGFMRVALYSDGLRQDWHLHRLVASIFLPGFKEGYEVEHKNGMKSDNGIANLKNTNNRIRVGL